MFTSGKETKDVNQLLYFEPAEGHCRSLLMETALALPTVTFDPERLWACPGSRRCLPGSSQGNELRRTCWNQHGAGH